jgi:hypothetical protein
MLRVELGTSRPYCDGLSRRSFLQLGMAGMASVSLPRMLEAKALSGERGVARKETSVILLWLDGGPSHMDLYDLKPEAPAEYRGIWSPIKTNVSGIEISELFPLQAKIADKFSIVRSLQHLTGDHFTGAHWMLTGRDAGVSGGQTAGKYPFIGGIAANRQDAGTASCGHARASGGAVCHEYRAASRLLRRQLLGQRHGSIRDGRGSERGQLPGA